MNDLSQNLLNLTFYNPIFVIVFMTAIWFIPGIIVRRIVESRDKAQKEKTQAKKISRLYPEEK